MVSMRHLGLDVGERNIGVAVGEMLAEELTTLRTPNGSYYKEPDLSNAIEELKSLCKKEAARSFVIGLPVSQNGSLTKEATNIKNFGENLKEKTGLPVNYVNETLTTFMAEDMLQEQGLSVKEAKERVDQLSAQLILQQYLEENALA